MHESPSKLDRHKRSPADSSGAWGKCRNQNINEYKTETMFLMIAHKIGENSIFIIFFEEEKQVWVK